MNTEKEKLDARLTEALDKLVYLHMAGVPAMIALIKGEFGDNNRGMFVSAFTSLRDAEEACKQPTTTSKFVPMDEVKMPYRICLVLYIRLNIVFVFLCND
jgi:hypothetical protein